MQKVPYYTTLSGMKAVAQAIAALKAGSLEVRPLQSYASRLAEGLRQINDPLHRPHPQGARQRLRRLLPGRARRDCRGRHARRGAARGRHRARLRLRGLAGQYPAPRSLDALRTDPHFLEDAADAVVAAVAPTGMAEAA
jgi:hypothetical protein